MSNAPSPIPSIRLPWAWLVVFFVLTFLITWAILGGYLLFPEEATTRFGAMSGSHPLFFLATWSPAIAAFTVALLFGGPLGLRAFLMRLSLWRGSGGWALFILLVIPLVYITGSLIKVGPVLAPQPSAGIGSLVSTLFMMLLLGPIEEFGWRGIAQPLLQQHMAPFWAGLLIGAIWGLWHLPAFFLSGTVFAEWNFLPFFVGNLVLAVLVTPMFNRTRGSLLWPMVFHWQLINPFWPDAQPWDTWILLGIAVVVVWRNRHTMFSRSGSVTDVFADSLALHPRGARHDPNAITR